MHVALVHSNTHAIVLVALVPSSTHAIARPWSTSLHGNTHAIMLVALVHSSTHAWVHDVATFWGQVHTVSCTHTQGVLVVEMEADLKFKIYIFHLLMVAHL